MNETLTQTSTVRTKKKPNWVARVFIFLATVLGVLLLTSCTKAFMSDADKTNVMYAYAYGQDSYAHDHPDEKVGNLDSILTTINSSSIPQPSERFVEYALSAEYDYDGVLDDQNRVVSFPKAVAPENTDIAATAPQQWIEENLFKVYQDNANEDKTLPEEVYSNLEDKFGKTIVETVLPMGQTIAGEDAAAALDTYIDAFQSIKAMAIFGGFDTDGNVSLWYNFDLNYANAQSVLGIEYVPIGGFANSFKTQLNTVASSNRAGLNTSGQGGMYGQPGEKIYITAKSWGEAFSKYGFLEGLLVWPFGWLLNSMITAFQGAGAGWAEFCAIMMLTFTVRAVLLVFNFFINKSQMKMSELQPQISALQAKYPNSETNKEEKMALGRETAALYKKNHIKPWLSILVLVIQFPLFICVWAALEGSALLASGNFFGIELTATMNQIMFSSANGLGTQILAIFLFLFMTCAQIFSSQLPMWFQTWKQRRFTVTSVKVDFKNNKAQKTTKIISWVMTVFVVFMGFSLPVAMSIYWYWGAFMSILQTIITELVARNSRHKKIKNGDSLSAVRRSKHHDAPIKSVRESR